MYLFKKKLINVVGYIVKNICRQVGTYDFSYTHRKHIFFPKMNKCTDKRKTFEPVLIVIRLTDEQ